MQWLKDWRTEEGEQNFRLLSCKCLQSVGFTTGLSTYHSLRYLPRKT